MGRGLGGPLMASTVDEYAVRRTYGCTLWIVAVVKAQRLHGFQHYKYIPTVPEKFLLNIIDQL
jgi:hypothetical protein